MLNLCNGKAMRVVIILFSIFCQLYAQNKLPIDSVERLAKSLAFSEPDSAITYSDQLIKYGTSNGDLNREYLGYYYKGTAFYTKAFFTAAIQNYLEAIRVADINGDTTQRANARMVLGIVYFELNDLKKAEDNYNSAAQLYEQQGNTRSLSAIYNNVGLIYIEQGKYADARTSFMEALRLSRQTDADSIGLANIYQSIGLTYSHLGAYDTALTWFAKSETARGIDDNKQAAAKLYADISTAHLRLMHLPEALNYAERSLQMSIESQNWEALAESNIVLSEYYSAKGDLALAMKYHLAADVANDSARIEQNLSDIARLETEFEYEKKIAEDNLKNEAELQAKRNTQIGLLIILVLVAVFTLFLYNRFRIISQQKMIIEKQKQLVDEKQQEVTDSINYARRIQTAVLPPDEYLRKHLPGSFVLYKPKDIVAGDFYWMEVRGDLVMFAACDCTGHGVPGALVSMICNNALNRAVRELNLTSPGKILDKVREIVVQEFEKSAEEVKDGMDISLCILNRKSGHLQWSGANNPLWIVRDGQIMMFKPDKQPIGVHPAPHAFSTHDINTQPRDMIYIFTDGFQDQFGGEQGKKFKPVGMRNMFLRIASEPLDIQAKMVDEIFLNWRTTTTHALHQQVDDVCIIGVRV